MSGERATVLRVTKPAGGTPALQGDRKEWNGARTRVSVPLIGEEAGLCWRGGGLGFASGDADDAEHGEFG